MPEKILYAKPSIGQLELDYVTDASSRGWGENCYDYINRFEKSFSRYLNVKYAIATSSCTGAMQMGLAGIGVGAGDEVILADTNWIATAAPIVQLGAAPIFVDILPDSWCIDPDQVELNITSRTKAIIATHLYGNLCSMDQLLAIGQKYGIPVIEDAAEAIGSVWKGAKAGSMGAFATFSFHGTKTITTGEGGMFVTNDDELYERVLTLSNHGRSRAQAKQFWPDILGFKYKMSNIQAALGCAQLQRVDELVSRKRKILSTYKDRFSSFPELAMNPEHPWAVNGAWMPTVVFPEEWGITREELRQAFGSANIDARVFFYPLSSLPMFEKRSQNLNAWSIPERSINLPSYHDMSDNDIDRVAITVLELIHNKLGSTTAHRT